MIIIKYYEWLTILKEERLPVYELCNSKYERLRNLRREDAIRLIKEHKLRMVFRNRYGAIFEQ